MLAEIKADFNPEVLSEALKVHGLCHEPEPEDLEGFESYVFACQKSDTSPPRPRILKLYHKSHRSLEQIEAELDWVAFLAQKDLAVPRVYRSPQGRKIEVVQNNFFAVVTQHLLGTKITKDNISSEYFAALGGLFGRLHAASYEYHQKYSDEIKRPHWHESKLLKFETYLPSEETELIKICNQLIQTVETFPQNTRNYGLVHGDLHDGNFLLVKHNQTLIQVFDFDDCEHHWFANDIAVNLFYLMHRLTDPQKPELKTQFAINYLKKVLSSYRQHYEWSQEIIEQIQYFLRLRDVFLYTLLHKVFEIGDFDQEDLDSLERRQKRILTRDPGCNWQEVQLSLKSL